MLSRDTAARAFSEDAERAAAARRTGSGAVVSPTIVSAKDRSLRFAKGFLARDPDGHAFEVIER